MTEAARPKDADGSVVLTPMIDVVFQLLVFFLFTLRFRTVDERIQSELPTGYGTTVDETWVEKQPAVRVRLTRDPEAGSDAPTRVRVGRAVDLRVPPDEGAAREAVYARLVQALEGVRFALGDVEEGEILTPQPGGAFVPHGDVVLVLDALIDAGVANVGFEGRMPPLAIPGRGGEIER